VIYGITGFKIHAKVTQVIRQEQGKLKFYMHFGTGNYNAATAKIYTDVSLLTCRDEFATDTTTFFHILSGFSKHKKLTHLSMSPTQIKPKLISLINGEAKAGKDGHIILKMNSLVDMDVIRALYHASSCGTKIDMIIRGICCLRPGVKGLSENIKVKSIIGKYLEHSRIFYFKNTEPNIYISSADCMPRNLERRLELMTPICDKLLQNKLIEMLKLQISDNTLSWELNGSGEYHKTKRLKDDKAVNNHIILEEYVNKIYTTMKKDTTSSKAEKLAKKLFKES